MKLTESEARRFWGKVNVGTPDECWNWTASTLGGYGNFRFRNGTIRAHRLSYEIHHDELPKEKPFACHRCDNKKCVNPFHLFAGNDMDNVGDRNAKGRTAKGEDFKRAKLTEAKVIEIRVKFAAGARQIDLAKDYGMDVASIWHIVHRRHWRHI